MAPSQCPPRGQPLQPHVLGSERFTKSKYSLALHRFAVIQSGDSSLHIPCWRPRLPVVGPIQYLRCPGGWGR